MAQPQDRGSLSTYLIMAELLYLVDAHSLIYQSFHAIPHMTGPKGQPTNALFGFTGDLLRLRKKKPRYLICAFDPPGKTFRDAIDDEYKAQRPAMPDELQSQLPTIRRIVAALRIPVVEVAGYEADDAIATIARAAERRGIDVRICTADKDFRQLISDRVRLYNLRKDQLLGREELLAEWGVTPDQVVDLLTLVGDSVDNVKGVPGVGIKTAQKLLGEFGAIEGILANLEQVKGKKLQENLRAFAGQVERNRQLIRLADDVPLQFDWEAWQLKPIDTAAALRLFQECGFHRYANEVRAEASANPSAAVTDCELYTAAPQGELFTPARRIDFRWRLIDSPRRLQEFANELNGRRRIALDLETTDLDPHRAEIVGYAVSWSDSEGYYLAVRGPKDQPTLAPHAALAALLPVLQSADVQKVNQNIKFDLLVLRSTGVELSGVAGDPMIADYLLNHGERIHNLDDLSQRHLGHTPISIESLIGKGRNQRRMDEVDVARVAEYAAEDAVLAWRLCEKLEAGLRRQGLDKLYHDLEMPLVEVLAEMEYNGIAIDCEKLRRLSDEFAVQLQALEREIHSLAGRPFNINSPTQLRQVLFHELGLPESRRTGVTGEASTRQEVLEELAAEGHLLPKKIIEYRQITKLKGTYVDALPELINPKTGRVHASFNQTATATGRLSSSEPNLQNIPVRTEQGRQIRQAFVPSAAGWLLLTADYSQVELRVLAHFSADEALCRAFAEECDIHVFVAAQLYGVPEEEVTSDQRRMAKTVNFGVLYGQSAFGLARQLGVERQQAEKFIDDYYARYPGVLEFQKKVLDNARAQGYVSTILGRRRDFDPTAIRANSSYRQRNQAEREALNTVIQGSAADLIKQAMLNIHRRLRRDRWSARMLLQIHDELVFEAPAAEIPSLAALVAEEMTAAIPLNVPLKVEVAAGENWLDVVPINC